MTAQEREDLERLTACIDLYWSNDQETRDRGIVAKAALIDEIGYDRYERASDIYDTARCCAIERDLALTDHQR